MPRNATAKRVATSLEEIERIVRHVVREELKRVTRSLQKPIEPGSPLARDLTEIARRIRLRARKEVFGERGAEVSWARGRAKQLSRAERNRRAAALLREWMADESGYDEMIGPLLEDELKQDPIRFREQF